MSLYQEMPGTKAADPMDHLEDMVETYGIDSVMGALSDSMLCRMDSFAEKLVRGGTRQEVLAALGNYEFFDFAHQQIWAACEAIKKHPFFAEKH